VGDLAAAVRGTDHEHRSVIELGRALVLGGVELPDGGGQCTGDRPGTAGRSIGMPADSTRKMRNRASKMLFRAMESVAARILVAHSP
jgi:hypothetical protein